MGFADTIPLLAFAMGLLSACSLPLGTLTTRIWTPGDRSVAILMAFGGGALLAALTIDLVGSALAKGHFLPLAFGCVAGGLLFRFLNEVVNNKGGFLRKSSTVILHLQRRRRERFARSLAHRGRVDLFAGLPSRVVEDLAKAAFSVEVERGATLYRQQDPSERMYVIEDGAIELLDPQRDMAVYQILGSGDAFGHMGCFTGAPRATVAVAVKDTRLWVLPKDALDSLLSTSSAFLEHIAAFAESQPVTGYLRDHHGLADGDIRAWIDQVRQNLHRGEPLPPAVKLDRKGDAFLGVADRIGRFPLFRGLPAEELRAVADSLICKHHGKGETLFHQHDPAERLYIVEHGEVLLVNPAEPAQRQVRIGDHQAFGGFSFLTGARHTVSALVTEETVLWVLRKRDFDELLKRSPQLGARVRDALAGDDVAGYLEKRHAFDAHGAARWARKAIKSIDSGGLIPSAAEMANEVKAHGGAPIAIWLGILLDGIPEALVIGASLLNGGHVSYSLIAGLFLSNYPEALSSSVGMRQQGMSFARVLMMWSSLMIMTGIVAAIGAVFFAEAPPTLFSLVEGIAAGAMLTMIAETMMPEAYFKGGSVVGLSTLLGFLVAIFFTTLH